jgi:hypothetical protein
VTDIYTVEIDGVEYDIEGDRPPTEAEARAAIGGQGAAPPAEPQSSGPAEMLDRQLERKFPGVVQQLHGVERMGEPLVPPGLGAAGKAVAGKVPGVMSRAAGFVERHPTAISMATGAAPGIAAGNPMAAVMGAAMGFDRAPALGRRMGRARQRVSGAPAQRPAPQAHSPAQQPSPAPQQPSAAPPVSHAPQAAPSVGRDAFAREILKREPNWRTVDAVPVDAIKRDVSRGGSIIEAGESRIALGERLAAAVKKGDQAEIERLAKAIRQREHISGKTVR